MVVMNEVMEGYVTMKKILAMLTVIVMLGCMLSVTAFADGGYVPSPKHDDEPGTTPIKRPHFIKKEPHKCCAVYGAFFPF